jgi:predicted CoA-binding protein
MLSEGDIRHLLTQTRTIAVVGLSANPSRDSYGVARFLQRNGYRIIPVNPTLTEPVLGEVPYASLRDVDVPIDLVNIFRRPEHVHPIVEEAVDINALAVWMQLGVINQAAATHAQQAGLGVVMDRCIAIEHRRLMRGVGVS